jgi:threonylcarbamoyladenosine tRNA methylthiotransferase CDKAL1
VRLRSITTNRTIDGRSIFISLKPQLIDQIKLLKGTEMTSKKMIRKNPGFGTDEGSKNNEHQQRLSFWIEGYGCSANFADLEMMAGQLKLRGFRMAENPENSSINLIVTCSVKNSTEHKMINRIKYLTNTNRPLIIAGCLPAADRSLVKSANSHASIIGPNSIDKVVEVAHAAMGGQTVSRLENSNIEKINIPKVRISPIVSIVEISTGCLSECTFCQTKLAKGHLRSYRIGEIVKQIREDLEHGSKEIWLSSTDNGCYGLDIGTNLVNLLRSCEKIEQEFRIRLGMMNPMYINRMINDLSMLYSESNKLFKFIHIPIQSGSERILRKMKRGHTVNTTKDLVTRLKDKIPEITIATDIITGFPTETDEDFEQTLDLISFVDPDIVNSSKFSSRPGTAASKLKKVNDDIISSRSQRLHNLIKEIANRRNSNWINWEGGMLINEIENGKLKGRNDYYKSIILDRDPDELFPEEKTPSNHHTRIPETKVYQKYTDKKGENMVIKTGPYKNSALYFDNPFMGKRIRVRIIDYSNHVLHAIPV